MFDLQVLLMILVKLKLLHVSISLSPIVCKFLSLLLDLFLVFFPIPSLPFFGQNPLCPEEKVRTILNIFFVKDGTSYVLVGH